MEKNIYIDGSKIILMLVLLSIANFLPFFAIIAYLFWPLPIVYFILKYESSKAILIITIAALLNFLLFTSIAGRNTGLLLGLYSVIGFGLIGFILGTSLKEQFEPLKSLLLTQLAVLFSNIIIIQMTANLLGINYQELFNEISKNLAQFTQMEELSMLMEQYFIFLRTLFPALLTIAAVIIGSLIYYITHWYIQKTDFKVKRYKPIKFWFLHRWILSSTLLLSLIFRENIVFSNLSIILMFLVFLQGFAVIIYYLLKKNSTALNIIFALTLIPFNFIYFPALAFIGLVDLWFDLRKIKTG
ncbi:DUF2232 domain-containing protein [Natronospora cellulosivora (SeqCode)]